MPGFMINNGGGGPPHTAETKRNHRWYWQTMDKANFGREVFIYLQKCQRPKFVNEEPVMHHNQEQAYFVGKQSWEPITMTFYDAEQPVDISSRLWDWLNVANKIPQANVAAPEAYKSQATLEMLDGVGVAIETWTIYGAWPKEVSYSDNDYTNTDISTVEVIVRYDRAVKTA